MTDRMMRFGALDIEYDATLLTPRPWTIAQSLWAIELLAGLPAGPVLELCAGAGHIGLLVGAETGRALVQVDVDDAACTFARRNASAAGLTSDVRCGDLSEAVADHERFPLVLADPPYVTSDEVADLPDDPDLAIDGGVDGLDVARTCVTVAAGHLDEGGLAIVQLRSSQQAEALADLAAGVGMDLVETRNVGDDGALLLLCRGTAS